MLERIDQLATNPWLDGPTQFLISAVVDSLRSEPTFALVFGEFIDAYQREDYGMRNLPALRMYSLTGKKTSEDWFIDGEIKCDAIFPPRIRRADLMAVPSMVVSALMQQFRRVSFFTAVGKYVPGLNRLGRELGYDHSLALRVGDDLCPVSQITMDYRIDLRQWDRYLEANGRTVDQPFEQTLLDLRAMTGSLIGLRDDGTAEVTLPLPALTFGGS